MKHEQYFNDFLAGHVNLDQSRVNTLDRRVKTITDLLKAKLSGYKKYSQQGSYAHQTIIKPVQEDDEFDADILVFVKDDDFDPNTFTDYVKKVHDVFKGNNTYNNIVRMNSRCVIFDYAGDFHLDVVPCIEYGEFCYICNRDKKQHEKTDGDGYTAWLKDKNKIVGGNNFRKTTRLIKFLRDHKDNFSVKSILLTTILGNQISNLDKDSSDFSDLPTTLKTLSNRTNDFLRDNKSMPTVENPVLPEENFNRHWDKKKYANFRDKFDSYNTRINEAFEEKDSNESVKKWRKLFGDDFGKLEESISSIPAVGATKPYSYD